MDPQQKAKLQKVAMVPLVGVFAVVLLNSLRSAGVLGGPPAAPPASAPTASAPTASRTPALKKTSGKASGPPTAAAAKVDGDAARIPYTAEADGIRDPFVDLLPFEAPVVAEVQAPAPTPVVWPTVALQGIIWEANDPHVIIDGQIYRTGNTVQEMRIVTITRAGVTVEMQGSKTQLTMSNSQPQMASPQGQATGLASPYPPSRFPGGER